VSVQGLILPRTGLRCSTSSCGSWTRTSLETSAACCGHHRHESISCSTFVLNAARLLPTSLSCQNGNSTGTHAYRTVHYASESCVSPSSKMSPALRLSDLPGTSGVAPEASQPSSPSCSILRRTCRPDTTYTVSLA
jgi:hypothetical protein